MALYEVTVRGSLYGQSVINVFSYSVTTGVIVTPSASELLNLMGFVPVGDPAELPAGTLFAAWRALVSVDVNFLSVEARELYSLTDFFEVAYSPAEVGGQANSAFSPFVAFGVFSNRVRTDIRRGFKRFAGVTEAQVDAGGDLEAGAVTALALVASKMSLVLSGATADYSPSVISREKVIDPVTGKVTYQLYADPVEQFEHTARGVTYAGYDTVRSQTSRQYGRGV